MAWRSVLSCFVVAATLAAIAPDAAANGRPPGTSSITFRQDTDQEIAVGLTFGLLLSHDGGKTWTWLCENAFPYSGMYDPKFAYAASGALFATTFDGIKVMRDSCTFNPASDGKRFVTDTIVEPAGNVYYTASEPGDASATPPVAADYHLYRSTDDGVTFPNPITVAGTTMVSWWQSILAAPSSASTMYLSGYAYVAGTDGKQTRKHLMYRSTNAGQTWTDLLIDATAKNITLMPNSVIDVVGIASDDPKTVYIRVELDDNTMSDSIYVSRDSGATWTKLRSKPTSILGFVVRAAQTGGKHDLVLATQALGTEISHDDGATWEAVAGAPHINCLTENKAGELWACTQNYGSVGGVTSDDAGIMKTTDLATWTKVLRYQDLTDAATCAADTVQAKTCAPMWCAVCAQLGCHAAASYNCPVEAEAPAVDPGGKDKGGCCDAGATTGTGALALGLVIGTVLLRPRRRRQADHEPGARCP